MSNDVSAKINQNCPLCGKARTDQYKPFCSKRCADIDLGRWLNESYVVPTDEAAETDINNADEN